MTFFLFYFLIYLRFDLHVEFFFFFTGHEKGDRDDNLPRQCESRTRCSINGKTLGGAGMGLLCDMKSGLYLETGATEIAVLQLLPLNVARSI